MRKFIAGLTALVLIMTCFTSAFGAVYPDVTGTVYEEAVRALEEKEIVSGYEDGSFRPENTISRAEACSIVINALGASSAERGKAEDGRFSDLPSHNWAKQYIGYAVEKGVVRGYEDGTFKPDKQITYNEIASMLVNASGVSADELSGAWPDNYHSKAVEMGIYQNLSINSSAEANSYAVRGDVAVMVYNVLDQLNQDLEIGDAANDRDKTPESKTAAPADLSKTTVPSDDGKKDVETGEEQAGNGSRSESGESESESDEFKLDTSDDKTDASNGADIPSNDNAGNDPAEEDAPAITAPQDSRRDEARKPEEKVLYGVVTELTTVTGKDRTTVSAVEFLSGTSKAVYALDKDIVPLVDLADALQNGPLWKITVNKKGEISSMEQASFETPNYAGIVVMSKNYPYYHKMQFADNLLHVDGGGYALPIGGPRSGEFGKYGEQGICRLEVKVDENTVTYGYDFLNSTEISADWEVSSPVVLAETYNIAAYFYDFDNDGTAEYILYVKHISNKEDDTEEPKEPEKPENKVFYGLATELLTRKNRTGDAAQAVKFFTGDQVEPIHVLAKGVPAIENIYRGRIEGPLLKATVDKYGEIISMEKVSGEAESYIGLYILPDLDAVKFDGSTLRIDGSSGKIGILSDHKVGAFGDEFVKNKKLEVKVDENTQIYYCNLKNSNFTVDNWKKASTDILTQTDHMMAYFYDIDGDGTAEYILYAENDLS